MSGKVDGRGQAKILSGYELDRLISVTKDPYRLAIAIAAYTACRMSEAIALKAENLKNDAIVFTRTKTGETRAVPMHPKLKALLADYNLPKRGYLFPSSGGKALPHITRQSVDKELRAAAVDLGIEGIGTHSFRRTALTAMKDAGTPLANIAAISGHKSLNELARYLDVSESDKIGAIATLPY
ncbi:MAG TPA: site-specific integrase [Chroococcidiopsis sp.]